MYVKVAGGTNFAKTPDGSSGLDFGDFVISPKDLATSSTEFSFANDDFTPYTGLPQTPTHTVTYTTSTSEVLTANQDYTFAWTNNVKATISTEKPTITITGKGNYTGSRNFVSDKTIAKYSLTQANVDDIVFVTGGPYVHTGSQIKPTIDLHGVTYTDPVTSVQVTESIDADGYTVTAYGTNLDATDKGELSVKIKSELRNYVCNETDATLMQSFDIEKRVPSIEGGTGDNHGDFVYTLLDATYVYDSNPHGMDTLPALNPKYIRNDMPQETSCGAISIKYQEKTGTNTWTDLASAPVNKGSYRILMSVAGGVNFTDDFKDGKDICYYSIDFKNVADGDVELVLKDGIAFGSYNGQVHNWVRDTNFDVKFGSYTLAATDYTYSWENNVDATDNSCPVKFKILGNGTNFNGEKTVTINSDDTEHSITKYETDQNAFNISWDTETSVETNVHKFSYDLIGHGISSAITLKSSLCGGGDCASTLDQATMVGAITIYYKDSQGKLTTEKPKDAGTYSVFLDVVGGRNFTAKHCTSAIKTSDDMLQLADTIVIQPKDLTTDTGEITLANDNFEPYNGTAQTPTVHVTYKPSGSTVSEELEIGTDYTYTWSNNVDATRSGYTPTVTATGKDKNYTGIKVLNSDKSIPKYKNGATDADAFNYTIPDTITYDTNTHIATNLSLKNIYDGHVLNANESCGALTYTYTKDDGTTFDDANAPKNVGTYTVYIHVAGGSNFAATAASGLNVGSFQIVKRDIDEVTVGGSLVDLGTYNGQAKTSDQFSVTFNNDTFYAASAAADGQFTFAWTNNIDATVDKTANEKATLTITATGPGNYSGVKVINNVFEIKKYKDGSGGTDNAAFDYTLPSGVIYDMATHAASFNLKDVYAGHEADQDTACGDLTIYYAKKQSEGVYDTPTTTVPVNAGTYKVYLQVQGGRNFLATTGNGLDFGDFVIAQKNIADDNVSFDGSDVDLGLYDSTAKTSSSFILTYSTGGNSEDLEPDDGKFAYVWSNNINATVDYSTNDKKAKLIITADSNSNYYGSRSQYFDINKYDDYNNVQSKDPFAYNLPSGLIFDYSGHGVAVSLQTKYNNTMAQSDACGALSYTYALKKADGSYDTPTQNLPVNAGTYKLLLSVAGGHNFDAGSSLDLGDYTISPKDLNDVTGVVIDASKVDLGAYDGTAKTSGDFTVTYNGHQLVVGESGQSGTYDFYYSWAKTTNASYSPDNIPELTITAGNSGNYANSQTKFGSATSGDPMNVRKFNYGVTTLDVFNVIEPDDSDLFHQVVYSSLPQEVKVNLKSTYTSTLSQDDACGAITVYYEQWDETTESWLAPTTTIPVNIGTYRVSVDVAGGKNFDSATGSLRLYSHTMKIVVYKVYVRNLKVDDKIFDMNNTCTIDYSEVEIGTLGTDTSGIKDVVATFDDANFGEDKTCTFDYSNAYLTNQNYGFDIDNLQETTTATIDQRSLEDTEHVAAELDKDYFDWDNQDHLPLVSVTHDDVIMIEGEDADYTVVSKARSAIGTYNITVTGVNNYCDTLEFEWTIDGECKVIEGDQSMFTKDSGQILTLRCNAAFEDFDHALLDGVELATTNYDVYEGSTVIDLMPAYLDTLPVGLHTLTYVYKSGLSADGIFYIDQIIPEDGSLSAPTGDMNRVYVLFGSLMLLVAVSLIFCYIRRRRRDVESK